MPLPLARSPPLPRSAPTPAAAAAAAPPGPAPPPFPPLVELAPAAAPVAPEPCTTVCGTHTACGPALTLTRTAYQPWLCSSMFTNLCSATHSSTTATKPSRVRASPTYDNVASLMVVLFLLVPAFVLVLVVRLLVVMGAELFAAAPILLALVVLLLVAVAGLLLVVVELARRELVWGVVEVEADVGAKWSSGGLTAPEGSGGLVVELVDGESEGAVAVRWGLGGAP